jgi:DNA-binding response OmpR family regulator
VNSKHTSASTDFQVLLLTACPEAHSEVRSALSRAGFLVLQKDAGSPTLIADCECDLVVVELTDRIDQLFEFRRMKANLGMIPVLAVVPKELFAQYAGQIAKAFDEFVLSPLATGELTTRARQLMDKLTANKYQLLTTGNLVLRPQARSLQAGHREVRLTEREYALMLLRIRAPGHVFSQQDIMQQVWQSQQARSGKLVKVYVNRLRSKLADARASHEIETVRGKGYRLRPRELSG